MRLSARKVLAAPIEQLHKDLRGEFTLVFDDGEMEVDARSTILSAHVWEFHRRYPKVPLLKAHHVKTLTEKSEYGSSTHLKLINRVLWDTRDAYLGDENAPSQMQLAALVYETSNRIYNDLVTKTDEYIVSLDITDFIEIANSPKVKEVLDHPEENGAYINKAYSAISHALKQDESLKNNNLSRVVRAGLVRHAQVLQCLGPRGYVTDLDSHYFPKPITRSFMQGMRSFYNILIESRSSSKSLGANKDQISSAEYFARRLQILDQIVERVHPGDCGSTKYLHWRVRDAEYDQYGNVSRPSDLTTLEGLYYLTDQGELKAIKSSDKHLLGKHLKIRSIVAGCNHPDPNGVCATCLGEIALSIPPGTNLGHLCASYLTEKISQSILSTKHLQSGSGGDEKLTLRKVHQVLLAISKIGLGYNFDKSLEKCSEVYMVLAPSSVSGLVDLNNVDNVEELATTHVSEITAIGLVAIDKEGNEFNHLLTLEVDKKKASFTYAMLRHVKKVLWHFDTKGNYRISLKGWDYHQAAFRLPQRQYSMDDFGNEVAAVIESSVKRLKEEESKSVEESLVSISDLVNSKISVSLAILSVVVLGSMLRSRIRQDYYLPKAGTSREIGVAKDTIFNRSMSGVIAYDAAAARITDASSLFNDHRPQLPMDIFVKPQEVITDKYRYSLYFKDPAGK